MKYLKVAGLVILSMCFAVACASSNGKKKEKDNKGLSDEPEWATTTPDGCSVGIVKYRGNRGMARSTATSRARDALARQLRVKVEGMIKDYQAQGSAKGEDFSESRTSQVSRQVVNNTLVGTKVQASYVTDDEEPHYYTLVCLKPEVFADAFAKMKELSMEQRKALKKRAESEFDDLDKQLKKMD